MKTITSRSNAIVSAFRSLADAPDPQGARMLLDGTHLVREAHQAGLRFETVAISITALDDGGESAVLARTLDAAGEPVVTVTEPVLRALSPVHHPSGLVAIARRPSAHPVRLDDHDQALLLVAVDVQDPGNLGALIRVAEAGGVTQVIVCGASAHPFGWRALRGSMGSALRMPILHVPSTDAAAEALEQAGIRTVAAVPREGPEPDAVQWHGRVAIVLGGEGSGLDAALLARMNDRVTIPMNAPVESLNVAAAGAVLVYAARRQRSVQS